MGGGFRYFGDSAWIDTQDEFNGLRNYEMCVAVCRVTYSAVHALTLIDIVRESTRMRQSEPWH